MAHTIEGLNKHQRIEAKSWSDELLHNASQTQKFFDKNTTLADIPTRHQQKNQALQEGKSIAPHETSKDFERSNVKTIQNIRDQLNIFNEFALKNGATDAYSALSPNMMQKFIKFREQQVYDRRIQPNTFEEYMSKCRIFASLATKTDKFLNFNVDKMTSKAMNRVNAYVEKMKNTDNPVVLSKHKVNAFLGNEPEQLIANVKDEKVKVATEVALKYGFRIENVETIFLNSKWQYVNGKPKRVYSENQFALVSKGNQRHTITFDKDTVDKIQKFTDDKDKFHVNRQKIRRTLKKSADELGIKWTSFHSTTRATYACRRFLEMYYSGNYSVKEIKQYIARAMFHGRIEVTEEYLRPVLEALGLT